MNKEEIIEWIISNAGTIEEKLNLDSTTIQDIEKMASKQGRSKETLIKLYIKKGLAMDKLDAEEECDVREVKPLVDSGEELLIVDNNKKKHFTEEDLAKMAL